MNGKDIIPADLGRELYEALKEVMGHVAAEHGPPPSDDPATRALARYEREVLDSNA